MAVLCGMGAICLSLSNVSTDTAKKITALGRHLKIDSHGMHERPNNISTRVQDLAKSEQFFIYAVPLLVSCSTVAWHHQLFKKILLYD
jgi:hypothetical protein